MEEETKEEEEERKEEEEENREKDDMVGTRGTGTTGIFPAGLPTRCRHDYRRQHRGAGVARPLSTRGTTVNFDLATAMFPIRTRPASRMRPFPRNLETRSPVSETAEEAPSFPFVCASLPPSALTRDLGAPNYYLQPDRDART